MLNAYKSAFNSFKIGTSLYKAPFLGFKSIKLAHVSQKLNPDNFFAYVQLGNIDFYLPYYFGGDKLEALNYYLKAQKLLEKDMKFNAEDWNYISILVLIGQCYYYLDDYESSKNYYDRILNIAPNFYYVKNELYPKITGK